MSTATVIRFPVEDRISTRVAEEKIGGVVVYGRATREWEKAVGKLSPDFIETWIRKKSVLFGWETVREGLVHSFKSGRVRHFVSDVNAEGYLAGERPCVELLCGCEMVPVWNWQSEGVVTVSPVILLSQQQEPYFRVCKHCAKARGGDR